jgi:hypothetical protein
MNFDYLELLSYDSILEHVFSSYIKEFGERKFHSVFEKIWTSRKINELIQVSIEKKAPPGSMDYLYIINEIPFFIFSRGQTQAIGALIALQKWHEEVNLKYLIISEEGLKIRALKIIEESKATFF